jgi:lipopolysaccharide transport system permease protein
VAAASDTVSASPSADLPRRSPDPVPGGVPDHRQEIVIRPPGVIAYVSPVEMWQYRGMLLQKVTQRIQLTYNDMVLSLLWAVARPVIMVFVFWAFKGLSKAKIDVEIPYPIFLYVGLITWFFFRDATTSVALSVQRDAGLMKKVYFPRLLSPISYLLAETYTFCMAALPLSLFMLLAGAFPGWRIVLFPVVLGQTMLLALGVGLVFSALGVRSRDWDRVLSFALMVGLWLNPVVYAVGMIPEHYRALYCLNPLVGGLEAMRSVLFSHYSLPWGMWGYSLMVTFVVILVGLIVFQRAEQTLTDRL